MVEFRLTTEDAIKKAIETYGPTAGVIATANEKDRLVLNATFKFEIGAKYAKLVLADYLRGADGAETTARPVLKGPL